MKGIIYILTMCAAAVSISACALTPQTADVTAEVPEQTAEAEITVTNDITVGITSFDTYNPLKTASPTIRNVCGFIYEPLFSLEQDYRTTGVLAESSSVSADGKTLTVKLAEGVKWHDGTEFTAKDAVYTINALKNGGSRYSGLTEPFSGVWAADSYTLMLSLSRAVPNAEALLIFPIIKSGSENSEAAIGTGPFYLNGDRLTAFEEHHGGRASLDTVYLMQIPDEDKYVSLYNASVIDFATPEILDMESYMPKSNSTVNEYVTNNLVFVGFNCQRAVFSDKSARCAVSELIDREDTVSHIYYSHAAASEYAINPASWLAPQGSARLRADTAEAASILRGGGWDTDANGKYFLANGAKALYLKADILVSSESAERVKIAEELRERMNASGMTASVTRCTSEQLAARVAAGNFDMVVGETELLPNNDISALAESGKNSFGYSEPEVDTMLAQLSTVQNAWDLKALTEKLFKRLSEDMPIAPICFTKDSMAVGAKLKSGVYPSAEGLVRATGVWSVK